MDGGATPTDVAAHDIRLARRRQVEAAVEELGRALRDDDPTYAQHVEEWAKALDHEATKLKPFPIALTKAAGRLRTPEHRAARDRFARAVAHARSHFRPSAPPKLGLPAVPSRLVSLSTLVRSCPARAPTRETSRPPGPTARPAARLFR